MADRLPFLASLIDGGKNIGKSWMYGFNAPYNIASGNFKGLIPGLPHAGSVGGMATIGGLGGIGAAAGAVIGSQLSEVGTVPGAVVGGAIGMAAMPVAGLAASAVAPAAVGAYKAASALAGAAPKIAAGIGSGTLSMLNSAPVATTAAAGVGFAKSMINWSVDAGNMSGVRLSKLGIGAVAAGAGISAVRDVFQERAKSRMGQNDGMITRATPSMQPAYANNAGATGDLVFALNANRRG